ncbi:tetratricopeptide repeat protein [Novipirellula caenicola]|uniref:Tetratricopeptide repeat protein n=1 Tax=Novipirellula caenicola TaxID=1536901 RepID=A0ABP9VZ02_9BACT
MSQSNPFSEQYPAHQPDPASPSTKRVLIIVAIIMAAMALFCAGLGTIAYVAMQRMARPATEVELAAREDAFQQDAVDFNRSLDRLLDEKQTQSTSSIDPAIEDFVNASNARLENGDDVPFSLTMFIEAVAMSNESGGSLSIIDRLALRNWLTQFQPNPDAISGEVRILDVRIDSTGKLAVVDLMGYSDDDQVESLQWFLVYENGKWKFYDWQRLEFGRRLSDEYASYLHGDPPLDEGYDNALAELSEAEIAWYDDDLERAKQIIRKAEMMPMLPQDRPVLRLQAAYTWMRLEQYDEAVRVLKSIESPNSMWGVWPSLAVCYYNLAEYDLALQAVNQAQKQSPNHPNGFWIGSLIYDELDQNEKASVAAIQALRVCPLDSVIFYNAIAQARPQDVAKIIDIIAEHDEQYQWTQLLSQTFRKSSELPQAIVDELKGRSDVPSGLLEIALGNLAWSHDQLDAAAAHFLAGKKNAESDYLKTIATENHLDVRLENDDFDQLFAESPPDDDLLRSLVLRAYDDSLYCDLDKLLSALKSDSPLSHNGWHTALSAWANYTNGDYEQAVTSFDAFLAWRNSVDSQPTNESQNTEPWEATDELDEATEDELDDDSWLDDVTADYLVDSLLELNRPLEILQRWPDDAAKHNRVGSFLLLRTNSALVDRFLESTATTHSDSVRLQRLRIQAAEATANKEAEQSMTYHRQAIDLGSSVYEADESYFVNELIRQFASDLVYAHAVPADTTLDDLDFEDTIDLDVLTSAAIRESIRIADDNELAAWLQRAEQLPQHSDNLDPGLQSEIGDYYLSINRLQDAIDAYQRSVEHSGDDSWSLPQRIEDAVAAMVRAGQVDEAKQWIAANPIPDSEVADQAVVDIANGDFASLQSHLDAAVKSSATGWLQRRSSTIGLNRDVDSPELADLIRQYPLRIPYILVDSAGELLRERDASFEPQPLADALESVLGESFTFESVKHENRRDKNADTQAWLFQSTAGQRILISWRERQYQTDNLPGGLGDSLSTPVMATKIAILDEQANSLLRLFSIASELAGQDAKAFRWSGGDEIWSGPKLQQQLAWTDRVPVQHAVKAPPLREAPSTDDDEHSEYEFIGIDEWEQHLKDAGGTFTATLDLYANGVRESIPCTINQIDADEYDIYISVARDSVLVPFIKTGFTYTCGPSNLSLPKTKPK